LERCRPLGYILRRLACFHSDAPPPASCNGPQAAIDLSGPLTLRRAFRFPLQTALSRRELVTGGWLLLLPFVGWLLNMGHRIAMVRAMHEGRSPWPAWRRWRAQLRHGLITWLGMVMYYAPSLGLGALTWGTGSIVAAAAAGVLFVLATVAIPGYMTHYCRRLDPTEIFNPVKALRRCIEGGRAYWHAWAIASCALALSLLGLLALGVGFLWTSVWFWQVAGYSFAHVFTQPFAAPARTSGPPGAASAPALTRSCS
jgi:hypothetical protein